MKEIFFETFFSLARLSLDIQDNFFQEKLVKKTKELFNVVGNNNDIAPSNQMVQRGDHVAPSGCQLLKIISDLEELVEIIVHLKLVSLSPALLVEKNLLRLKTEILGPTLSKTKKGETKIDPKNSKDNYSSQKLLNYLKTKPAGAQTIDIVHHFENQLSRRTIQRYLNELVSGGLIKKDQTGGFPKYFSL